MVETQQQNILKLIKAAQLDEALVSIGNLSPTAGEWKYVLEIRVLRMLKRHSDALAIAENLHSNQSTPKQELSSDILRYCLLYTSPSPRDQRGSRMPSSA